MSTHYKNDAHEKLILATWTKFSRAHNSVSQVLRQDIEQQGCTPSQFGVMEVLHHVGPLSVKEIGQKLLLTPSNMVTVIDNLVKQDLAKRVPCDHDRRSMIIHLTSKGETVIKIMFRKHLKAIMTCFGVLDEDELKSLGSISRTLGLNQTRKDNKL